MRRTVSAPFLLAGNVGRAGTQALLLWFFAAASGATGAGHFALALAVLSPVFMLTNLALREIYQTMHPRPAFRSFLTYRVILSGGCTLVALGAIALCLSGQLRSVFVAVAVLKLADALIDIFIGRMLAEGRIAQTATAVWFNLGGTVSLVFGIYAVGGSAVSAVYASAVMSAIVAAILATKYRHLDRNAPWLPLRDLGTLTIAGIKLGTAQTVVSVTAYVPTYYLAAFGTAEVIGIYAACQYAVTLANLVFMSVQQMSLRTLREAWIGGGFSTALARLRPLAVGQIMSGVAAGALTVVLLPVLLPRLFGPEFDVTWLQALPIGIAVVAISADTVAGSFVMAVNRYSLRAVLALLALVCGVVIAVVLGAPATVTSAGLVLASTYSIRALITVVWVWRAQADLAPTE